MTTASPSPMGMIEPFFCVDVGFHGIAQFRQGMMATFARRVVVWRTIDQHPEYEEIHRFEEHNKKLCKAAMLIYLDLTEAKNVLDVGIHHNTAEQFTYFSGRENDDVMLDIFVPMTTDETLSIARIHGLFEKIIHPETQAAPDCIMASIIDDDSTVSYYRIHRGIVPPPAAMIMNTEDADSDDDGDDEFNGAAQQADNKKRTRRKKKKKKNDEEEEEDKN